MNGEKEKNINDFRNFQLLETSVCPCGSGSFSFIMIGTTSTLPTSSVMCFGLGRFYKTDT